MYNELYQGDSPLGVVHIVIWFGLIFLIEIAFRIYQARKPRPFNLPTTTMSLQDFKDRVARGEKLVIVD
jgi:hypothetical protein